MLPPKREPLRSTRLPTRSWKLPRNEVGFSEHHCDPPVEMPARVKVLGSRQSVHISLWRDVSGKPQEHPRC